MNHHQSKQGAVGSRAARCTLAVAVLVGFGSAAPVQAAAADPVPVVARSGTFDIVEVVHDLRQKAALDRAARPWAYGATWKG